VAYVDSDSVDQFLPPDGSGNEVDYTTEGRTHAKAAEFSHVDASTFGNPIQFPSRRIQRVLSYWMASDQHLAAGISEGWLRLKHWEEW
jgi:hypothetical protein